MYNFTLTRLRIDKSYFEVKQMKHFNGPNIKVVNVLCFFTLTIKLGWFL